MDQLEDVVKEFDFVNKYFRFFGLLELIIAVCGICYYFWNLILQPHWFTINTSLSDWVTRVGIFLQFLGGASVLPEVVGRSRLKEIENSLTDIHAEIRRKRGVLFWLIDMPSCWKREKYFILTAGLIWSVCVAGFYIFELSHGFNRNLDSFVALIVGWTIAPFMGDALRTLIIPIISLSIRLPLRRLITLVTFPLMTVGTFLELLATFFR
jgi:hypothetical protein